MKKFFGISFLFFVAITAIFSGCANEDEKLYHSAISKVDTGGIYLNYNNHTDLVATWNALCLKMMANPDISPEIPAKIKAFILGFNLKNMRASACSIKNMGNDIFRIRHALLMSSQVNSAKRNTQYRLLKQLPEDTILAVGGKFNAQWCWHMFGRIVKFSEDPKLSAIYKIAEGVLAEDAYAGLLDSIAGEYQMIVCGKNIASPDWYISLPDKNGKFSSVLKAFLPFENNEYKLPATNVTDTCEITPVIRIEKRKIVIADSDKTFKHIADTKYDNSIFSTPKFQRFAKGIPDKGIFYMIANVDGKIISDDLLPENVNIMTPKRDYTLVYNLTRDFDAYCGSALTDIPVSKIISTCGILLLSPMMLL